MPMAKDSNFEKPDMAAFAEKSVEQVKTAFDSFLAATRTAVNQAQSQALSAQTGVREMSELAMRYTERNIAASFEFAQKLMQARDAKQMADLHAEYIRSQMVALTEQAQELGKQAAKVGMPQPKP
jgi:hypothetical protein